MNKALIPSVTLFASLIFSLNSFSQVEIEDMKWGADYNIHVTFSNDSTSIMDIKGLYHSSTSTNNSSGDNVTYYPVKLDKEFVDALKNKKIESFVDTTKTANDTIAKSKTLWSAIHNDIEGGWIHFINCLVYSLESGQIKLTSPLMKRPESDWKPSPMTETYKRTKNWEYYIPHTQKLAHKEYKIKEAKGELANITLLPENFITLFLETNDKEYAELVSQGERNKIAIIDMVKLLLGANYLGQEQIDFLQSSVQLAVKRYSVNSLPSVIIFDDFNAAVAMTLDNGGYKIEKITFKEELSDELKAQRIERMNGIIAKINEVNKKVFEQKLKSYYN